MIAEVPDWLSFRQKHLSIKANTQQVVVTLFHHAQKSLVVYPRFQWEVGMILVQQVPCTFC